MDTQEPLRARAESDFSIADFTESEQKLQVTNFFLGLLHKLEILNPDLLVEKLWQTIQGISSRHARDEIRKDTVFKLSRIDTVPGIDNRCQALNTILRQLEIEPSFQAVVREGRIAIENLDLRVLKPHTAALRIDGRDNIVFGAAPEFIKAFLGEGEEIPEFIVLGDNTFRDGINFSEIEFTIYRNFFFHQGRKVKVVCSAQKERQLRIILQVTLMGPDYETLLTTERDQARWQEFRRLKACRDLLIPRDAAGAIIPVDAYVEFITFREGRAVIPLAGGRQVTITGTADDPDRFTVLDAKGGVIGVVDLARLDRSEFGFPVQRTPLSRDEFGVFVLDSGDGFSPDKHTSSFLLWLEGRPLLVDPMAYSDLYLKRKGIDTSEIVDIFISHNHGDHDQGVYNYLINGRKIRLLGSAVVIEQTLQKVAAAVGVGVKEIMKFVDVCSIPVGQERKLPGYDNVFVKLEYTLHPIPCNMIKFHFKDREGRVLKSLGYSGDTLFAPDKFAGWVRDGKLEQEFVDIQLGFFHDVDVLIHEAGGGTIHTEMEPLAAHYRAQEIYWVHTAAEAASVGNKVLRAGDQITLLPEAADKKIEWYIKLFEQVPLFTRFSHEENYRLARMAVDGRSMEIITYMAGEEIFRQGDLPEDDSFFVIAQGALDVFQDGRFVASLGIGQQLGEMAVFGNNEGRRNATVKAFSGVKLVRITRAAYEEFMQKINTAYQYYSEARPALEASNSPFRGLNHNILDNIAARMEKQVFARNPDGSRPVIITKDQPCSSALYLIMEGEAGAIVDRDKRVGFKLGKGSVIGEMSLLDPSLRPSATVIAITDRVVTFTLSRGAFNELIEKYPPVRYILEGISRRRRQANERALGV